jgi:hypothetical protein
MLLLSYFWSSMYQGQYVGKGGAETGKAAFGKGVVRVVGSYMDGGFHQQLFSKKKIIYLLSLSAAARE